MCIVDVAVERVEGIGELIEALTGLFEDSNLWRGEGSHC